MIYLKDYSKLEECISEEINKESSLLQSIYKETGDSEERVDRFAKLIDGVSQSDILVLGENDCAAREPFKIVTQGNKGEYWTQQYIGLLQITSDGTKEEVFIRSRFDVNESCEFSKYMLNKALGLKANILQNVEPSVGRGEILDLILAIIFTMQIARAYRKGIYRRYRTYENNDSKLKGRIDVARHIRLNPIFNGNIAYSSREYTADNDMNRMILTAYTSLQKRQPGLMRELEKKYTPVKDFISQLKNIMQPVSRQEARKLVQKERKKITHAVYSDWESVRKTAILILKYMGIAPEDDGTNVNGILINMNYIWERYLVQIVKEKIENKYQIEGKKSFGIFFPNDQSNESPRELKLQPGELKLQPDLVISDKDEPLLIIDAKYKNEWENVASDKLGKPDREDCFQIMSYMYRAKCKFGGIFCPQTKVRDESDNGKMSLKEYFIFEKRDEKAIVTLFSLQINGVQGSSKEFAEEMEKREDALCGEILKKIETHEELRNQEMKKIKDMAVFMNTNGMEVKKIAYYLNVNAPMIQEWIDESSIVQ